MDEDMYYEEDVMEEDMEALLEMEAQDLKTKLSPSPKPTRKLRFSDCNLSQEQPVPKKARVEPVLPDAVISEATSTESFVAEAQRPRPGVSHEMPEGDFMCVAGNYGDFVYVTVDETPLDEDEEHNQEHKRNRPKHLLTKPITELKASVMATRRKKMEAAVDAEDGAKAQPQARAHTSRIEESLWVKKYEPKYFHELLSGNEINLEVLTWLKEWDLTVFGSKKGAKAGQEEAKGSKPTMDTRPFDKILLLTGGPGVGKTTLAHVLAKHAGYHPTEVNASMDRTEKELKQHFISATGQQTTLATRSNLDRKPPCLIVDEIDGVASSKDQQSAVQLLVQMAKQPLTKKVVSKAGNDSGKANDDEEDDEDADGKATGSGSGGKRKPKGPPPLLRPVICICNNPFAPALRELKNISKVFTVPDVSTQTMAARLKTICVKEGLNFDRHALVDLCSLAAGDIRSCLMTMQFLKTNLKTVTNKTITESNVGIKDQIKPLFPIWEDIFSRKSDKMKYMRALCNMDGASGMGVDDKLLRMRQWKCDYGYYYNLQQIMAHPEQDRILDGCFDMYTKMRYSDVDGIKTAQCMDWFAWMDTMGDAAFRNQAYGLKSYLPFAVAQCHLACSVTRKLQRLEYPNAFQTLRTNFENNRGLLRAYHTSLPLSLQQNMGHHAMVQDQLSYLLYNLMPKLKVNAANLGILSMKDKQEIKALASKYVYYNIGYVGKQDGMNFSWVLDIDLDKIVKFGDQAPLYTPLAGPIKQLLTKEIHFEKIRAAAQSMITDEDREKMKAEQKAAMAARIEESVKMKEAMKDENQKRLGKLMDNSKKVKRDFFGRIVESKPKKAKVATGNAEPTQASQQSSQQVAPKISLVYRYNEGFTNAVRKFVKTEDFL